MEVEIPDFRGVHLWNRVAWAQRCLEKHPTDLRCVYEDPAKPDNPVVVMCPSGRWMAMALAGGFLPPVESYLEMPLEV